MHSENCAILRDLSMVISALTLMASLVQAGVACGVIYRLNNLRYLDNYSGGLHETLKQTVDEIPSKFNVKNIARVLDDLPGALNKWVADQANNVIDKTWDNIEERLCFNLALDDFYGKATTT